MSYGSAVHELSVVLMGGAQKLLRLKALQGHLDESRVRSIAWRLALGTLGKEHEDWIRTASASRARFAELLKVHMPDRTTLEEASDPLSAPAEGGGDAWGEFFKTLELRKTVDQDVCRTHPEDPFFQRADVREILSQILLIYAKENPDLGYLQGMHELLAPILLVVHRDADRAAAEVDADFRNLERATEAKEIILSLLDPSAVAADSFALFEALMSSVKPWFQGVRPSRALSPRGTPGNDDRNPTTVTCDRIQGHLLRQHDSTLAAYLASLDLLAPLYILRWIRVLFAREFSLDQLLPLWDCLFAEDDTPFVEMVELVSVALIMSVRETLLHLDLSGVLRVLKDYPSDSIQVTGLIALARKLKSGSHIVDHGAPASQATSSLVRGALTSHTAASVTGSPSSRRAVAAATASSAAPSLSSGGDKNGSTRVPNRRPGPVGGGQPLTSPDYKALYDKMKKSNEYVSERLDRAVFVLSSYTDDENLTMLLADLKQLSQICNGTLNL